MKDLSSAQIISYFIGIVLVILAGWIFLHPPCNGNYQFKVGGSEYLFFECDKTSESGSDNSLQRSLDEYEAVQQLYSDHKRAVTCVELRKIIEKMRVYSQSDLKVPESFISTIINPVELSNPKISDLVVDRVARIKNARRSDCFR